MAGQRPFGARYQISYAASDHTTVCIGGPNKRLLPQTATLERQYVVALKTNVEVAIGGIPTRRI